MAWQEFSFQGVPYHQPAEPVVPKPDNTAANIISQGGIAGVHGFVQMALGAQQAQLEHEKMLQQADLQAQELQHKDKWQQQDYEIAKQNADSLSTYRQHEYDWHMANAGKQEVAANAKLARDQQANALLRDWSIDVNNVDQVSANEATTNKVLSPALALQNPGAAWGAATDFVNKYAQVKTGDTPALVKAAKLHADSLQVPYVPGAQFVTATGDTKGKPGVGDNNLAWRVPDQRPGATKPWTSAYAVGQRKMGDIATEYQDPVNRPAIEAAMAAAGHGKIVETHAGGGAHAVQLDPYAKGILRALKQPRPEIEDKLPSSVKMSAKEWQIKHGVGNPGATNVPDSGGPSQAEIDYINENPQYRGKFIESYGEDAAALLNQ